MKRRLLGVLTTVGVAVGMLTVPQVASAAGDPCASGANPIVCENSKPGTPRTVWDDMWGAGDDGLQGYATNFSVNVGETQQFKIKTAATAYSVDIYRLGWYGGNGARKVASVTPTPQTQPECLSDAATGLIDCGNWAVSATWAVPADAISGVYIARLHDPVTADTSQITFVIRNDASHSDVVFQTSDSTWQAYNTWGGNDFYTGQPAGRAYKLSYNRPFATRSSNQGRDFLFSNEYPMLAFLERNGLDISYIGSYDTDVRGSLLKNHKVFVSTGHDEYWSGTQRANVEAARDSGVNLAFFSGNEVYWKTRWEPSIDGSSTDGRTLTCYKETWANDKIDPSNEWTGTWRDPRFSPPSDGGRPENGLTGTAYMANHSDLAIQVSEVEGKLRLWRGTSLAAQAPGDVAALAPHTIGYESDEDLDNGHRPAGLIRLSTTTGPTPEYLRDFGNTVTPGTTTHHLTLYRAASGALVFGAGTIQWAWGLTQDHDGAGAPADSRIQQATLNILSDMGAQPSTTMAGLVTPTPSSDTTGPTVTITTPLATSTPNGSVVTVSGTATDVGGRVGGVEVSLDGGTTWHPATGTTSWTYSGVLGGRGAASVKVRASDDSANIGAVATVTTDVTCPCSLYGMATPSQITVNDPGDYELGVKFQPTVSGYIHGIRFYKGPSNTGTHTGTLWSATGTPLATGTFTGETASGWQTLTFDTPIAVDPGMTYLASYRAPAGGYSADNDFFAFSDWDMAPVKALGAPSGVANGVSAAGGRFPANSYRSTNYWVDVVFVGEDQTPPVVMSRGPIQGASSVPVGSPITASFARGVVGGSVAFTITGPAGVVAGATAYDDASRTATFTPSAPLAQGATYSVSLVATGTNGLPMSSPASWSFRTTLPDPVENACPCRFWSDSAVPLVASQPDGSVELGVRFSTEVDGHIQGLWFYKAQQNTGTHTGSVWGPDGSQLGTATFTNESSSGWQYVQFPTPIAVAAGLTYTASYRAPNGGYSYTPGGLSEPVNRGPLLTTYQSGTYTYGTGIPNSASSTNYWVDVDFVANDVAPTVASSEPGSGATNVNIHSPVSVTLTGWVTSGSANLTLKEAVSGAPVAGSVGWNAATKAVIFTPYAPLIGNRSYVVTVSGAASLSGAVMSPTSFSFRTTGATACPCSLFSSSATPAVVDSGEAAALNLGVRFTPTVDGSVIGLRFYKAEANTGTHSGSLWSSDGVLLARVTFTDETATGWQKAQFSSPIAVAAGTTYVVSYHAPNGHYSASAGFFADVWDNDLLAAPAGQNGVYLYGDEGFPVQSYGSANYWVDPLFTVAGVTIDTTPPTIAGVAVAPMTTGATISWSTDESASSMVQYGPTPTALTSAATGPESTNHSVALTGLQEKTTYYYRVVNQDAAGNQSTSPATTEAPASFTTLDGTPPSVSGITVTPDATGTVLTFAWTTDEPATSVVRYGTSAANLNGTGTAALGTSHSVVISGLDQATTYYYRVESADPSGNTTSSPSLLSAAASITTPDTTPPVVSSLAATGSGTTATISWTTNESSTTTVQYGTSATALTSTASAVSGTSHTVALSGLAPNTRYFYRVVSADPAGNATTSPAVGSAAASYAPSVTPIVQTTTADFNGSGTYETLSGDGELTAQPSAGYEMSASALPSGWTSAAQVTGGSTTFSAGLARVNGARFSTSATYSAPRVLEAAVNLQAGQTFGWYTPATMFSVSSKAQFEVSSTGQLVASSSDNYFFTASTSLGLVNNTERVLRIEWTRSNMKFYVDGSLVATHSLTGFSSLGISAYDPTTVGTPLAINWVRVGPYAATSTYTSGVIDAGAVVGWDTLTADQTLPTGTTVTLKVRSGNTVTPGADWTAYANVGTNGTITRSARYVQYQVVLTTSGSRFVTPVVRSVALGFRVL